MRLHRGAAALECVPITIYRDRFGLIRDGFSTGHVPPPIPTLFNGTDLRSWNEKAE